MININVFIKNNNWFNYIEKPNNYLKKKINKLNLKVKKFKSIEIFCTLLLSGNKEIRSLNKKFRKKIIQQIYYLFHFKQRKSSQKN